MLTWLLLLVLVAMVVVLHCPQFRSPCSSIPSPCLSLTQAAVAPALTLKTLMAGGVADAQQTARGGALYHSEGGPGGRLCCWARGGQHAAEVCLQEGGGGGGGILWGP